MGKKFEGKRVFLTGAASGVGKATLELFQAEGANVAGVDITEAEGLVWCDITDEAAVQQAMATAVDRLGGLDICLNVAGGEGGGLTGLEGVSLQTWNRALAVNLTGPMLVLRLPCRTCARARATSSPSPRSPASRVSRISRRTVQRRPDSSGS